MTTATRSTAAVGPNADAHHQGADRARPRTGPGERARNGGPGARPDSQRRASDSQRQPGAPAGTPPRLQTRASTAAGAADRVGRPVIAVERGRSAHGASAAISRPAVAGGAPSDSAPPASPSLTGRHSDRGRTAVSRRCAAVARMSTMTRAGTTAAAPRAQASGIIAIARPMAAARASPAKRGQAASGWGAMLVARAAEARNRPRPSPSQRGGGANMRKGCGAEEGEPRLARRGKRAGGSTVGGGDQRRCWTPTSSAVRRVEASESSIFR